MVMEHFSYLWILMREVGAGGGVYEALGVFEVESVSSRVVFLGSPDSRRAGLFLSSYCL